VNLRPISYSQGKSRVLSVTQPPEQIIRQMREEQDAKFADLR
jgi:hypothetical protein